MPSKLFKLFCSNSEFVGKFKTPQKVFGTSNCLKNEELLESLEYFPPFGSDCIGGYAYFGTEASLNAHWEAVLNYIKSVSPKVIVLYPPPIAARWALSDNRGVIALYNDYDHRHIMETPLTKNVLSMKFGAWVGDDNLTQVLKAKTADEWLVGKTPFIPNKSSHETLYTRASNTMDEIVLKKEI